MTNSKRDGKRIAKSSSSKEEGNSWTSKDALELGREIVDQLGMARSNDTLGRWMAHHIAELIKEAEVAPAKEKHVTQARVADAILRLWERRLNVESHLNPFKDFKAVASTLLTLNREKNSWLIDQQGALSSTYDGLRRLVLCLAFRSFESLTAAADSSKRTQKTKKWLSPEEKSVIETIGTWISEEQLRQAASANYAKNTYRTPSSVDFTRLAEEEIPEIKSSLDRLAAELANSKQPMTPMKKPSKKRPKRSK